MLRLLLILILSPIIILAATTIVCALIETGFNMVIKIGLLAMIFCGVKFFFARCRSM